jgi:hypothetical protein
MNHRRSSLFVVMLAIALLTHRSAIAAEETVQWPSAAAEKTLTGRILSPENVTGPLATVVYLTNLSARRLGTEPDEPILADLHKDGDLVLVLDYAHDPKAISPDLNADALKLRTDISKKQLLKNYEVDPAHIFILDEGCRLKRDVEFYRDGSRVLGMDIAYPSNPTKPVPVLMEFTCDNKDRMGNASLLFCHDTLVDGGMAAGFAVAMADHPVPPPYKGLDDPMSRVVYELKAAVRTLRAISPELHLNGQIGVIGFSRGGPMAAILAVSNGRADLEGDGPNAGVSSDVQAALIHGNRYDYLKLGDDDPMLKRFEKAWGPRDANEQKWAEHGASYYLPSDSRRIAPMFLNTSDAESKEYQLGLKQFDERLTELHVGQVYQVDKDGRGHRVSTDPKTLASIYGFFTQHLGN